MCCFSKPIRHVGGTRIFARRAGPVAQFLAYAMEVELDEPLAMILPIPVPPGSADDAVRFLDLSGYPDFFEELDASFPPMMLAATQSFGPPSRAAVVPPLEVHRVGDFEASFVPGIADFARLDPRFRLPDAVSRAMVAYADYGFAVFQLAPEVGSSADRGARQRVHPMAFSFPTRESKSLFFPTVHVHDGTVPATAAFDHTLYCQDDGVLGATLPWQRSLAPLGARMRAAEASGLVVASLDGFALPLHGVRPNVDTILVPPEDVTLEELTGAGACHRFWIGARSHYGFYEHLPSGTAWRESATRHLGAIARGLRLGLEALEKDAQATYAFAPLTDSLPPHFMNGSQLWSGSDYRFGAPIVERGPGRLRLEVFTDRVEPQTVEFGFARVPDAALLGRLSADLRGILDRSLPS